MDISNNDLGKIYIALEISIETIHAKLATPLDTDFDKEYWETWVKDAIRIKSDVKYIVEKRNRKSSE